MCKCPPSRWKAFFRHTFALGFHVSTFISRYIILCTLVIRMPMNRRFTFASRAVIIVVILCNEFIYFGPLITASTGFIQGPQCDTSLGLRQPEVWNASCHVRYCRSRQIIYISFINILYICNIFIFAVIDSPINYLPSHLPPHLHEISFAFLGLHLSIYPDWQQMWSFGARRERERARERAPERERERERVISPVLNFMFPHF